MATGRSRTISIRIPVEVYEHLRRLARHRSVEVDQTIGYADLIREAIRLAHPLPSPGQPTREVARA